MQRVDFTQLIKDEAGRSLTILHEDGEKEIMTLGSVCILCLKVPDEKLSMDDKVRRGELALRLHGQDKLDMELTDISLMLELVGRYHHSPMAVTRVKQMLDGPVKSVKAVKNSTTKKK